MLSLKQAKCVCDNIHRANNSELKASISALSEFFEKDRDKKIIMFYLNGYHYVEIASLLNVSIPTIYRKRELLYNLVRCHLTEEQVAEVLDCFWKEKENAPN